MVSSRTTKISNSEGLEGGRPSPHKTRPRGERSTPCRQGTCNNSRLTGSSARTFGPSTGDVRRRDAKGAPNETRRQQGAVPTQRL